MKVFDVKSGTIGGTFDTDGSVKAICFSENGTWLAVATQRSSIVNIFDLRKTGPEGLIKSLETGSAVEALDWDYTAQFLLTGGRGGVTVQSYAKSSKEWSEPLRIATDATSVAWGPSAQSILALNSKGGITGLAAS